MSFQAQTQTQTGLTYMLGHFNDDSLFPRTISTKTTQDRQIVVYNEREAMARFTQANFLDCKISAFPWYADTKNGKRNANKQAPNLIFIDHDFRDFKSSKSADKALERTVSNIRNDLGGNPTVIGSGHGYHVYEPVNVSLLENYKEFLDLTEQPSRRFLQYMELRLSGTKSDHCHNHTMSLRNCMLRIPGSYNAKISEDLRQVELLRPWDGIKASISKDVLFDFYLDLCDKKMEQLDDRRMDTNRNGTNKQYHNCRYVSK